MTAITAPSLRRTERDSIRAFVQSCSDLFADRRVLDYGCGRQPYRDVVEEAGGVYLPYDRLSYPANVSGRDMGEIPGECDAVLCTQVIQYVSDPRGFLALLRALAPTLVITGPTNWPIVEQDDLWRLTSAGIRHLLFASGFEHVAIEARASVEHNGESWPLGWGAVARA